MMKAVCVFVKGKGGGGGGGGGCKSDFRSPLNILMQSPTLLSGENKHRYVVVYGALVAQFVVLLPIAPKPIENGIVPQQQEGGCQHPPGLL